jgi:hypothetical protein
MESKPARSFPPPTPEQAAKLTELVTADPKAVPYTVSLALPPNGSRTPCAKQVQEWIAHGHVDEFSGTTDPTYAD